MEQFLTSRTMHVKVRGSFSEWICVLSGVPQGSVFGSSLFLLFVNDLPDWVVSSDSSLKMFADDTIHCGNGPLPPGIGGGTGGAGGAQAPPTVRLGGTHRSGPNIAQGTQYLGAPPTADPFRRHCPQGPLSPGAATCQLRDRQLTIA